MITILVKTLNEERNIHRCLTAAMAALASSQLGGEVIICDSGSTDETLKIAREFDVRILQLADQREKSCGIGAQMGFAYAVGEFIYILDGDMELDPGFLRAAVDTLRNDENLAGVGGLVTEMNQDNEEFQNRARFGSTAKPARGLTTLDMGGLYKREAIESVGYLTNRNLHAFEEFELGMRLVCSGWRLDRLNIPAVSHYGHVEHSLRLLLRRWRTRYVFGHGELLREVLGGPHFWFALRNLSVYRIQIPLLVLWISILSIVFFSSSYRLFAIGFLVFMLLLTLLLMAIRKNSIRAALYSVTLWHVGMLGLLRGFFSHRVANPCAPVAVRVLR